MGKRKPTRAPRKSPSRKQLSREACDQIERDVQACFDRREFLRGLQVLDEVLTKGRPTLQSWKLAGQGLIALEEFAQAIPILKKALALAPDDPQVRFNLAGANYQMGRVDEAVSGFAALADEGNPAALCNLATIIPGGLHASQEDILRARLAFGETLRVDATPHLEAEPVPSKSAKRDRIRVGYVSAYFHRENYMKPVASLIREHDRSRFELRLFADNASPEQIEWFQADDSSLVIETTELDNEQLKCCIRDHDLDVVVDLNAYSVPERLPIYGVGLARVNLAWFNMYATSGLPGIDWIVGDPWVVTDDEDRFYSERIIRLPISYLAFGVHYEAPPIQPPPCLQNGFLTFGSLVSQYKLTPEMWDAWSEILKRVPRSRFVMGNRATKSAENRSFILREFQRRGVEADRIAFLPPAEHASFLRHYDAIDIALDAWPYNGGTTTTEALWQGVPVVAANGDRWAARTSRTLLANAKLDEFIAPSHEEYVATAVRIALRADLPQTLSQLRREMRDRLRTAAVCNVRGLARAFEKAMVDCLSDVK